MDTINALGFLVLLVTALFGVVPVGFNCYYLACSSSSTAFQRLFFSTGTLTIATLVLVAIYTLTA